MKMENYFLYALRITSIQGEQDSGGVFDLRVYNARIHVAEPQEN